MPSLTALELDILNAGSDFLELELWSPPTEDEQEALIRLYDRGFIQVYKSFSHRAPGEEIWTLTRRPLSRPNGRAVLADPSAWTRTTSVDKSVEAEVYYEVESTDSGMAAFWRDYVPP